MSYLHIVSVFPALTETFVLREARQMRELGWDVILAPLRPTGRRPTSPDFEDLRSCVSNARPLGLATLAGLLLYTIRKPLLMWKYVQLVFSALRDPANLIKLIYILLASMTIAYRLRGRALSHARGHHLHSEALAAMFVGGFLGIPYSFKCYTVKTHYPRAVLVEVVHEAEFIVADTVQVRDFLSLLGSDPSQVHLIRNSVPLAQFPMKRAEPVAEPPIILAIGRLDYKKGFHVLLSACSILREGGVRFRCVIVGDGDERRRLLDLRSSLRLEQHVELVGKAAFSEVQHWFDQATLMVVPSVVAPDGETDGLPTVVIEAFARGVPVIATYTAGIPEVVRDGATGLVAPPNSPDELAKCIRRLLENEPLRQRLAAEARRTAELELDLEANAYKLGTLILGPPQKHPAMWKAQRDCV